MYLHRPILGALDNKEEQEKAIEIHHCLKRFCIRQKPKLTAIIEDHFIRKP